MASLKEQLEAAGFDTSNIDEAQILSSLDAAGFDTSSLQPPAETAQKQPGMMNQLVDAALPPLQVAKTIAKQDPEIQRGVVSGMAALTPGMVTGPVMAAGAGGAIDMANSPVARDVVVEGAKDVLKGNVGNAVMRGVKAVDENKEGVKEFAKRRAEEFGTALIPAGLNAAASGVKAVGPVTAAMREPKLISGTVRQRIMAELGMAKEAARAGEDIAEASRLRRLLTIGQAGKVKLAEEAIEAVNSGKKLSNTQLLAYEEALGKTQTKGGTFAHDYDKARKAIRELLKKQAPTLDKFKGMARNVFVSEGQGEKAVSLIDAVQNPVSSAMNFPGAGRMLGAGIRGAAEAAQPLAQMALSGARKANEFNLGSELDKAYKKRRGK